MPALHLVNHTPQANGSFSRCLSSLAPGDGLLLIEDAVYAALRGALPQQYLAVLAAAQVFVLAPDLEARALSGRPLTERFEAVDFDGFVELIERYDTSVAWG